MLVLKSTEVYSQSGLRIIPSYKNIVAFLRQRAPGGQEESRLTLQEKAAAEARRDIEGLYAGHARGGGSSSHCLVFFGTSRPVSKVT